MKKGSYGYLRRKRRASLLKSAVFLAAVFAVYFGALHHFHTNKNVFSILAAVGALPTGRSIVETIMCFRARSASERVHGLVTAAGDLPEAACSYDLYLTAYERAFSLSHCAVRNGSLIGLTEAEETDTGLCEQHIREMLRKEGIGGIEVQIYRDPELYAERLKELFREEPLKESEESTEENDIRAMNLLKAISL